MIGDPDWQRFTRPRVVTARSPCRYLIWGDRDIWVATGHYAPRLAADTGAGLTIVLRAEHMVHQVQPERFNETAVRFLKGEGG